MHPLVIFIKSFRRDVERTKKLLSSIQKFNTDNIPVFLSVPREDLSIFRNALGTTGYNLIEDGCSGSGWTGQQCVKMNFATLGICKNYVVLDSDCQFCRPFSISDFMYDAETPYTIMHEQHELFSFMLNKPFPFDAQKSFRECRQLVMDTFDRKGIYYDFGPVPVIWNCGVWQSLQSKYLEPNGLTFSDLIALSPGEFGWYGEWLLTDKTIPLYPREPLMKVFHYPEQYLEMKKAGVSLEQLSKVYLGVVLQSNFGAPLDY